jgi:Skp family chaperone for outer membrane proteins
LWAQDLFNGMPADANYVYVDGKNVYLQKMDACLTGVANYVAEQLNAAKKRIADGQKEIQDYVAKLSPDLQKIGAEAADQIQGKFGELSSAVDSKQDELVESLTQKYNDKLKEVDARIEEMKAQNSGFINQAKQAIGGVIETIKKLADMLMSTLKSAAGAVEKILQDPITFLGNLLSAVKQGFMQFVGNIGKYMQEGLISWLTGAIGSVGVALPRPWTTCPASSTWCWICWALPIRIFVKRWSRRSARMAKKSLAGWKKPGTFS